MVSPDHEHPPTAEQVEIARAGHILQMGAFAAHEADVEPNGLQHSHHHVVQMTGVQFVTVGLVRQEQRAHIAALIRLDQFQFRLDVRHPEIPWKKPLDRTL